ncbi:MAG: PEP-CTERM sorting domain-containing protein [Pseudomonadota bacterium]
MKITNLSIIKLAKLATVTVAATFSFGAAHGVTLLGQAPDPSLIVSAGGMEWVYAAPCAGEGASCGPVQLHHDFVFATDAQWNASFASRVALANAFTTPNGGALCAASYFSTVHNHCDLSDISAGYIWHSPLGDPSGRNSSAAETFLVRASAVSVPEPASIALFGMGLLGFAASRRNKTKATQA